MSHRIDQVRQELAEHEADAALVSFLPNIRWACGFTGSNAVLVVRPDRAHFVTDGRYDAQAHAEVEGAEVHVVRGNLLEHVADEGLWGACECVLFQSDHTTVQQRAKLEEHFEGIEWKPVAQFLTARVASKDDGEVERIRGALEITESVFEHVLELVRPGVRERDLAAEIVYQHLRRGAEGMAFDPIVASGPNGALPHARPTDRTLQAGEMIVLDMGCFARGYVSDVTRTVALGEPEKEARQGYEAVLEAQRRAIESARTGMRTNELDAVARDYLEERGLGDAFAHSLGHGLGLEVHEWPRVSSSKEDELPAGVCVTIEPGVYVPEANYGVRIEDVVYLERDGATVLTELSRELLVL